MVQLRTGIDASTGPFGTRGHWRTARRTGLLGPDCIDTEDPWPDVNISRPPVALHLSRPHAGSPGSISAHGILGRIPSWIVPRSNARSAGIATAGPQPEARTVLRSTRLRQGAQGFARGTHHRRPDRHHHCRSEFSDRRVLRAGSRGSGGFEEVRYSFGNMGSPLQFAFPNDQVAPTHFLQPRLVVPVPLNVAAQLRMPEVRSGTR